MDNVNPVFLYKSMDAIENFINTELNSMMFLWTNLISFLHIDSHVLEEFYWKLRRTLRYTWNEISHMDGEGAVTFFFRVNEAIVYAYLTLAKNVTFFSSDMILSIAEFVHLTGTHFKPKVARIFDLVAVKIAKVGNEYKLAGQDVNIAMVELGMQFDEYIDQYAKMYGENLSKFFGFHCIYLLLAEAGLAVSIAYATAEDMATFLLDSIKLFVSFYGLERFIVFMSHVISDKLHEIKEDNQKLQKYFSNLTDDLPANSEQEEIAF